MVDVWRSAFHGVRMNIFTGVGNYDGLPRQVGMKTFLLYMMARLHIPT